MQCGSVVQLMQFTYVHINIILILIVVVLSVLTLEHVLPNYVSKKSFATEERQLGTSCAYLFVSLASRTYAALTIRCDMAIAWSFINGLTTTMIYCSSQLRRTSLAVSSRQ